MIEYALRIEPEVDKLRFFISYGGVDMEVSPETFSSLQSAKYLSYIHAQLNINHHGSLANSQLIIANTNSAKLDNIARTMVDLTVLLQGITTSLREVSNSMNDSVEVINSVAKYLEEISDH